VSARPAGGCRPSHHRREAAITTLTQPAPARITVGVDTHADIHVAVAKDGFGRRLDAISVPTTPAGYAELLGWAQHLGQIEGWGSRAPAASGPG
jgi:transposase